MKAIYTAILMCACYYSGFAQSSNTFIADFLSENTQYFEDARLKEDGSLEIKAKETFANIESGKKSAILELSLKKWDGEIIFIRSDYSEHNIWGYKTELWTKNKHTGLVSLIGNWDLNSADVSKFQPKQLETIRKHPWFFYVGGQANFNDDDFSLFLNARIGAFLYKDWWDVALSGSYSGNARGENTMTVSELGVMTKIYWSIKKYNLSPYIGGGLSWGYTFSSDADNENEEGYTREMLLLGTSWYVGPGSWDFGLQISKDFNVTVGYTFLF
ncbi:MAG: porin family protein [Odoribacteraceae bacterium]|jgi:hypothetical protein|nr:porin family protein [Odoribacteraceae bacterium]